MASATCLLKTGSETGFPAQNLDRLLDMDFLGRISDKKAGQVFGTEQDAQVLKQDRKPVSEPVFFIDRGQFHDIKLGFFSDSEALIIIKLSPDNTEIAIDEAEHLIDMCDEDEDERLTPDEIVDNHDLWVDSDATEYGAQLRHYDEL